MIRLTEEAHRLVREVLRPGDFAIDATAGNGHDTLFLAQCIAPNGIVLAIDIQPEAIRNTDELLKHHGLTNYGLFTGSHTLIDFLYPRKNFVGAVMFNLGYLPHGDHAITTQPESTIEALRMACEVIRPHGIITVLAYRGHPGGLAETAAVRAFVCTLSPEEFTVTETEATPTSPVLFVIRRCESVPSSH